MTCIICFFSCRAGHPLLTAIPVPQLRSGKINNARPVFQDRQRAMAKQRQRSGQLCANKITNKVKSAFPILRFVISSAIVNTIQNSVDRIGCRIRKFNLGPEAEATRAEAPPCTMRRASHHEMQRGQPEVSVKANKFGKSLVYAWDPWSISLSCASLKPLDFTAFAFFGI